MLMARSGHQVHLFAPPPLNAKPWAGIVAPADRMQRRMTPRWPFGALARPAWLAIVGIRASPGGLSSARLPIGPRWLPWFYRMKAKPTRKRTAIQISSSAPPSSPRRVGHQSSGLGDFPLRKQRRQAGRHRKRNDAWMLIEEHRGLQHKQRLSMRLADGGKRAVEFVRRGSLCDAKFNIE
jgi:hypothetical protein